MSDLFSEAQRRLFTLMSPAQLKAAAIQYLREGGETAAVAALAKCDIEYGDIYCQRGSIYEINITLRCGRDLVKKLQPTNDTWNTEPPLKIQLTEAIKVSLPSGYDIANLDARAMAVTAKAGSEPDDKTNSLLNYDMFIKPESLARMGRAIVISLLSPFAKDFRKLRIKLPDPALPDKEYFPSLNKVLSAKAKMPLGLIDNISAILELGIQVADGVEAKRKKELEKYLEVRLIHRTSGRGLLRAIAGSEGIHQDYPEKLTSLQSELVGWLLSYLRDFLDVGNDLEPNDLIKYEQEVSENLVKLEKAGLRVFIGNFQSKHIFENGKSYMMPTSVVLLAATNDPRINQDTDGTVFIKGLIEKGPADKNSNQSTSSPPGQPKRSDEDPPERKIVPDFFSENRGNSHVRTITINGKPEQIYHVTLWPLRIVLQDRTLEVILKMKFADISLQKKCMAAGFLSGGISLVGLNRKPDQSEYGIGAELASMLIATLSFRKGAPMEVYCRFRRHNPTEADLVFQEQLRSGADAAPAAAAPASEEKAKMSAASAAPKAEVENPTATDTLIVRGRFKYHRDCSLIVYDGEPHDLRRRPKAKACLKFLTEKKAFSVKTARHLVKEINPYVVAACGFGTNHDIKIQHYFGGGDGKLAGAAKKFIQSARVGKYYLKME